MEASIWLGFTCMLCLGKLIYASHTYTVVEEHKLTAEQVTFDKNSVTITFRGWKSKKHRTALMLLFLKGTENRPTKHWQTMQWCERQ